MSERVSGFGGSLKAEHGTGRMVAPFIEMEWGRKAYEINRRIKAIFDPERILNPDVIITDDPDVYKKTLKLNVLSMILLQSVWNVVSVKTLSKPQFNIDSSSTYCIVA